MCAPIVEPSQVDPQSGLISGNRMSLFGHLMWQGRSRSLDPASSLILFSNDESDLRVPAQEIAYCLEWIFLMYALKLHGFWVQLPAPNEHLGLLGQLEWLWHAKIKGLSSSWDSQLHCIIVWSASIRCYWSSTIGRNNKLRKLQNHLYILWPLVILYERPYPASCLICITYPPRSLQLKNQRF
jgi:hypothetical protein